jgi:acyl-CoA oxidase
LDTFLERLNSGVVSGEEAKVLTSLFKLYSLFFIDKYSGTFLQFNLINSSTLTSIQAETKILLSEIRPHLVGLTDAFKYPDEIINSSLGNFDGNFYTNYFDDVTRNNGKGTKPPYLDLLNATLGRDDKDQRLSNSRSKDVLEKLAP